ncbi:MAG: hypothetical protein BWY57_02147 [Betaproteobacteria bacterium ADurb.Bin341]|nr:MAG: hypothetical protein BWY57_02147 [Betaproteobacteria bacterium ADurb.Bin341]
MITDGIDGALIRFERAQTAAESESNAVDDLLSPTGDFFPFNTKNFDESLGEFGDDLTIKVCACLQAENFALAGSLIFDHCVDYWTERAQKHLEKEAEKQRNEYEADRAWREAA